MVQVEVRYIPVKWSWLVAFLLRLEGVGFKPTYIARHAPMILGEIKGKNVDRLKEVKGVTEVYVK